MKQPASSAQPQPAQKAVEAVRIAEQNFAIVKQRFAEELALRADLERRLSEALSRAQSANSLVAKQEAEVQRVTQEQTAHLQQMQAQHERDLAQLRKAHAEQVATLSAERDQWKTAALNITTASTRLKQALTKEQGS